MHRLHISMGADEGKGPIRVNRGEIILRDRNSLVELADGAYSEPEGEYRRLVGEMG